MIESINHANKQMEHFKLIPGLTEETLRIIRLELITAYRAGYELACQNQFSMMPKDER